MKDLIKNIRKKDKQAITLLYNRYGKKLYGYAVSRWQLSEDEAWEIVYKTLYKIIEVIDKYEFENESKLNGFVFQAFINNLRNHYQAQKLKRLDTVRLEEHDGATAESREEEAEAAPDNPYLACLQKAMEQMEDWKRILLLMKAQDFSYHDIARYVEKPEEQLKVYYLRAKQVITDKINKCINEL